MDIITHLLGTPNDRVTIKLTAHLLAHAAIEEN